MICSLPLHSPCTPWSLQQRCKAQGIGNVKLTGFSSCESFGYFFFLSMFWLFWSKTWFMLDRYNTSMFYLQSVPSPHLLLPPSSRPPPSVVGWQSYPWKRKGNYTPGKLFMPLEKKYTPGKESYPWKEIIPLERESYPCKLTRYVFWHLAEFCVCAKLACNKDLQIKCNQNWESTFSMDIWNSGATTLFFLIPGTCNYPLSYINSWYWYDRRLFTFSLFSARRIFRGRM